MTSSFEIMNKSGDPWNKFYHRDEPRRRKGSDYDHSPTKENLKVPPKGEEEEQAKKKIKSEVSQPNHKKEEKPKKCLNTLRSVRRGWRSCGYLFFKRQIFCFSRDVFFFFWLEFIVLIMVTQYISLYPLPSLSLPWLCLIAIMGIDARGDFLFFVVASVMKSKSWRQ